MKAPVALLCLTVVACTTTSGEPVNSTTSNAFTPISTETTDSGTPTTTTSLPPTATTIDPGDLAIEFFPVPAGSHPHDVAPAADGGVWYTAQGLGELGWLDPATGETRHIPLGSGSRPHGVIVADDGTPWITDGGLNAIVSLDPATDEVTVFPLPETAPSANLNTAVFDRDGLFWFTGQEGYYGWLDPATGEMEVLESPRGRGPYGITATGDGTVVFASLAGSYVGVIADDREVVLAEPPTPDQGARRVWADSSGSIWVSEWKSGNVSRLDLGSNEWETWPLPGNASTYAVYVDEYDIVWLSDFAANALVRFDPVSEIFNVYNLPHDPGDVRQILGRPGEIWGAESAADHLVLIRTR